MARKPPDSETIQSWRDRFANGESRADIAAEYGVSRGTVSRWTSDIMSSTKANKLGKGLIEWGWKNQAAVDRIAQLADGKYKPQYETLVMLAAAHAARTDLKAQTGGVAPTLRAVLYYMMANFGASKKIYQSLIRATAEMRKRGVWSRNYFTDATPDHTHAPGDPTLLEALSEAVGELGWPSDAFANAPFVLGVAVEARGGQKPMAGALEQQLGFYMPVFACSGMAAIPRTYNMENQMHAWAEQHGVEPIMLVITDYDPSGQVIANNLLEWLEGITVVHIGITPPLATEHNAYDASELEDDEEPSDSTHRRSEIWLDAVAEHGDTEYQVEAIDYATWAGIIAEHLKTLLKDNTEGNEDATIGEMRGTLTAHQHPFKAGDNLMAALADVVEECEGDVKLIAARLNLDLPSVKPTLSTLRKRRP